MPRPIKSTGVKIVSISMLSLPKPPIGPVFKIVATRRASRMRRAVITSLLGGAMRQEYNNLPKRTDSIICANCVMVGRTDSHRAKKESIM